MPALELVKINFLYIKIPVVTKDVRAMIAWSLLTWLCVRKTQMKNNDVDLTEALRTYCFRSGISVREFQDKMGWASYQHAWNVVSPKGKGRFSAAAWGRFLIAFGLEAFESVCKIARVELNGEEDGKS